jgi:hypothetical protein
MKVYHGSYIAINEVELSKTRAGRDFGRGFYVTKIRSQAEYWAERIGEKKNTQGVVTEFDFEEYAFEDEAMKVLRFDNYSEEWFEFVMLNRSNLRKKQVHDFDIVEGPVADDAVTMRIHDYMGGEISREQFLEELKFKRPSHQICFCTIRSLQMLKVLRKDADGKIMHIDDEIIETLMMDFGWSETQASSKYYASKIWKQLIDETTGLCTKPWKDIYRMLLQEMKLKK